MLIRRLSPLAALPLLLAAAPAAPSAATRPAASTPAAAAETRPSETDLSTPQATAISFLSALEAGNEAAAKNAIAFTDPKVKDTADLFLDILLSTSELQRQAKAKFGAKAADAFGDPDAALAARVAAIRKAVPAITNNDAAMTLPPDEANHQGASTIAFKKVGNQWKIDATSLFNLDKQPPEDLAQSVGLARKLLQINHEIAANIAAGKYASATEARDDWWRRSFAAAAPPASTQPATNSSAPPPPSQSFTR